MRDYALKHRFPAWAKAAIGPDIGSKQRALGSFAQIFDRAELDFHLACLRHCGIRAVERTIGLHVATPAGKRRRRSEGRDASDRLHEAGRNTQIAAGSFDLARTATNSLSSSGTNSEVRAPDTVGTRARCR